MSDSPNGTPGYKIGSEKLISVTERASQELRRLFEQKGGQDAALRVAVIGGGCAGLSYKMDLVEGPRPKDILVESLGVKIVVDPKSALYVSGSKLDFSDDLQNGGFQVTNPNAASSCSCGKSFST
jgi:iron-sulfur cluster assembly protein